MTVSELLTRIDSAELTEWQAYYGLEPWGEEIASYRAGVIAAQIYNCAGKVTKKALSPADFMPRQKHRLDSPETQLRKIEKITRLMGGRDLRKKK